MDDQLDRRKIVNIVTTDKNKLNELNKIVHKRVEEEIKKDIEMNSNKGIIVLDVPIPTKTGKIAEVVGVALPLLPVGSMGRITHIEDEPDIIYKQILAENVHLGSFIRVVENNETRIVFHAEGEEVKLAPIVAANLTISLIENDIVLEEKIARLSSLKEYETAKIIGISKESRGESRRRLLDLGFVKGAKISIDLMNPLGEPNAYLIKGTAIALRTNQASKILIKKD